MKYTDKSKDFLNRVQILIDNAKKREHVIRIEDLENTFPELL